MKYSIIGAGIGGLTTALAFEKAGIEYQIFEKTQKITSVGAGIWLAPNALQVLEFFNVLDEIQKNGNSIDRITLGTADLSSISDTYQNTIKKYSAILLLQSIEQNFKKYFIAKFQKRKFILVKNLIISKN